MIARHFDRRPRILVLDDSPETLHGMGAVLEDAGYVVELRERCDDVARPAALGRRVASRSVECGSMCGGMIQLPGEGMAFFIAHVAGRWTASRASSTKRASVDAQEFDHYETAEAVARARWPDGGYFIVEADDMRGAEAAAVGDSRALDDFAQ